MLPTRHARLAAALLVWAFAGMPDATSATLERLSKAVPFPRGLAVADGKLYVLARGRVRSAGGVTASVEDRAGAIFEVDLDVHELASLAPPSEPLRCNGRVVAEPTAPPFRLWDRTSSPPESDRETDRPYCTLRYHHPTRSFYLCAFSGIDKPLVPGQRSFSKNLTDAILRYDLRTSRWYEIERHDTEAGGTYPHHDPQTQLPPHGWLNGPDNCLPLGHWLYAVGKDNSILVRYDLRPLIEDPEAPAPESVAVLGERIHVEGLGQQEYYGHSALAYHDGWLYLAYRTSSVVVRLRLDTEFLPVQPIETQLVARFDPFDPLTLESANLTDMDVDSEGRVYVISAKPAKVFRFLGGATEPFDGRNGARAWFDLAQATENPKMKAENLLIHDGFLYVTAGDGYGAPGEVPGTVYRLPLDGTQ